MDEPLIWTLEDILRMSHDAETQDRVWAWDWLKRHHPAEASRHVARGLADPIGTIVNMAIAIHGASPTSEGAEAIAAFRQRGDLHESTQEALDELIRPTSGDSPFGPFYDAVERLAADPAEVWRRAPGMLVAKNEDTVKMAIDALGFQQHQWATNLLLEHFGPLLTSTNVGDLWGALYDLADPRSLPAIEAAWAPGECAVATLYARIHRMAGSRAPLPAGIARDVEAEARRNQEIVAFRASDLAAVSRVPPSLEIRCVECGRTGEYIFEREDLAAILGYAAVKRRGRDPAARSRFVCKYCGATNNYELTLSAQVHAHLALASPEEIAEISGKK